MKLIYIYCTVFSLFFLNISYATDYDGIISTIVSNNLELKQIDATITAQQLEIKTSRNLSDPTFDGKYLFGPEKKYELDISQSFDFPTVYSAKSKLRKAQSEAVSVGYLIAKQQLTNKVRNICDELVYLNKQKSYYLKIKLNFDSLHSKLSKALEYNEVTILDANKLSLELIKLEQLIIDVDSNIKTKQNLLTALNAGVQLDSNLLVFKDYQPDELQDLQYYIDNSKANDSELILANKEIQVQAENIKTVKMDWIPKFSVGYSHAYEDRTHLNGINFGVSIPIFQNIGKVKAAKAKHIETVIMQESKIKEIESQITINYNRAFILRTQLQKYKEHFSHDKSLSVLKTAVEGRELTVLQYLDEVKYYLDARFDYYKLEYDYKSKLTELNYFLQ